MSQVIVPNDVSEYGAGLRGIGLLLAVIGVYTVVILDAPLSGAAVVVGSLIGIGIYVLDVQLEDELGNIERAGLFAVVLGIILGTKLVIENVAPPWVGAYIWSTLLGTGAITLAVGIALWFYDRSQASSA